MCLRWVASEFVSLCRWHSLDLSNSLFYTLMFLTIHVNIHSFLRRVSVFLQILLIIIIIIINVRDLNICAGSHTNTIQRKFCLLNVFDEAYLNLGFLLQ